MPAKAPLLTAHDQLALPSVRSVLNSRDAEHHIRAGDLLLGVSNKPEQASSLSLLLERIYLQNDLVPVPALERHPRDPHSSAVPRVAPIRIGERQMFSFHQQNRNGNDKKEANILCCSSNFQHPPPSRDSIFKICSVLRLW